ncbi:hypothetical protein MSSIT_1223 [Methanosarcina siciliae T4/M]|uniref:Uncharacterized protein n=1 Tax=Methanosarcina siciliae T4/M TaxID=1434120 RepID=A0A0E3P378_9EURY|nr:hypothetical protein [Methanosarcina siciliae]AKB27942.1 hypothetical protein MSSIT_1223 [Methanosarcina siciliae T4/M]
MSDKNKTVTIDIETYDVLLEVFNKFSAVSSIKLFNLILFMKEEKGITKTDMADILNIPRTTFSGHYKQYGTDVFEALNRIKSGEITFNELDLMILNFEIPEEITPTTTK